jgi:hypothetical protein
LTNFEVKYIQFEDVFLKKRSIGIVANCLKILNLLSEVRLDDAEFTSILWREKCTLTSVFYSSGARVTKCGHVLESFRYAVQNGI